VTIGIPFRNPGAYFRLAVQSVFAQTHDDWELILLDDGSTDGSTEFARELDDPRIRVIADGHARNLNVRLNQIAHLARAPYLFRMDADDVMHPERVERQLASLIQSSGPTVVGTRCYSIDANSTVVGLRPACAAQTMGFAARHSFDHPSVAARTDWFKANPYSESFIYHRSQDAELWCRTAPFTNFINIPQPLMFYRDEGVFSREKYVGTELGIINLAATQYARLKVRYAAIVLRELTKIYIRLLFDAMGGASSIEFFKRTRLSEGERANAQTTLSRIGAQPLPIRSLSLSSPIAAVAPQPIPR
jgi:glycosyltransferase involved in cell wall biosynthesis